MANLLSQNIGTNYKSILNLDSTINTPLDATLRAVTDGMGTASPLQLATTLIGITSSLNVGGVFSNLARLHIKGSGSTSATTSLLVQNSALTNLMTVLDNGNVGINCVPDATFRVVSGVANELRIGYAGGIDNYIDAGVSSAGTTFMRSKVVISNDTSIGTASTPSARLQIKGSGSTSATTSLLVQNSAGVSSLQVDDSQLVQGFSGASVRFKLGFNSTIGQCISTRDGEFSVGLIDANQGAGLRFLTIGTGSTYLDGYTEGTTKATNYPLFIGSRLNNTSISVTNSTTTENGTQTIFGYAVNFASSLVTINSTTRGFLPPRMTTAQKNAIAAPAAGLVVFDTTLNKLAVYTTAWETVTSV